MTLTIEIEAREQAILETEAARLGVSAEKYARAVLRDALASSRSEETRGETKRVTRARLAGQIRAHECLQRNSSSGAAR